MRSTASLFNKPLFAKDLKRTWPVWVVLSVIASLVGFANTIGIRSNLLYYYDHPINLDARYTYYTVASGFMPISAMVIACIATALIWGYLYTGKSTVFFHSIPVSRPALFITNFVATYVITIIPMLVGWFVFTIGTVTMGIFDLKGMLVCLWAMIAETLIMVSISTLCAQFTGRMAIFVLLDLSSNVFFAVAESLFTAFAANFLYGVYDVDSVGIYMLSPVVGLINKLNATSRDSGAVRLEGMPVIAIYAGIGILLTIVAFLAYRHRKSEAATEVVAFRALKPILLYSYAILGAVFFTWFFYDLTNNTGRQTYNLTRIIILMILASTIMYFVGRMIIERTIKVFNLKNLPGYIVLTTLLVIGCFIISKDPMGYEVYTPDSEDISTLYINSDLGDLYLTENDLGLIEYAIDIQEAIAKEGEHRINEQLPENYISFDYHYKNGKRMRREYHLQFKEGKLSDKTSVESKLDEFYNLEPVLEKRYHIGCEFIYESATVYFTTDGELGTEKVLTETDGLKLKEALMEDIRSGRIPHTDIFNGGIISDEEDFITIDLCDLVDTGKKYDRATDMMLNAVVIDSGLAYGTYTTFVVSDSMTATSEFLKSLGFIE